ncbi:FAD-binding protein [Variovorax saccharolyticus]|uniref:FAD-binding protein n=1 Tax=Variovorax saccharolyticus TaxID=3053516 RepID=UPI002578FBA1|nr:FAD-binding protein [Variovorax sp. J22R187]MDM0021791.1 FAD-binding protein [Variovorax sp. J22R187]
MTVSTTAWDHETDVLIFGSGVAGFSAGVFARKRNLDVLICEKMPVVGGTTATSGGFAWVPNTAQSKAAGAQDSIDNARTYLQHELGNFYRADLVESFLEAGPEAMATLQDGTDVVFDYVPWPDYHADQVGGVSAGRTHEPRRFDGRALGQDFELIRPPIRRLMLLGGMSIDKRKVDDFLNPFKSLRGFVRVVSTLARFAADRTRYSRGTDIGAGNALIARLLLTLRKAKADLWVGAPLVELISESGRAVGAVVRHEGRTKRVRARHGVILATGGFPHNAKMRQELGPNHPHDRSVGWEANVGEGINAARQIGAVIDYKVVGPGLWQPSSLLRRPDGTEETILYGYLDRGKPGIIAVDASGRRFVNESNSYHDIGEAMFRHGVGQGNRFYFICDRKFVWKRGLGLIRPFRPSLAPYAKSGYVAVDDTLEGLAAKIGIDPQGLVDTVSKHNEYARTGVDPEFRRGTNPFNSKLLGDPAFKPNPNLGPIVQAPFVALQMVPSTLGTSIGLAVNAHSQVLDASERPIPGLYACGQDMSHVMRGFYPGGGINIGPAIVFAYVAVHHIVATQGRVTRGASDREVAFTTEN